MSLRDHLLDLLGAEIQQRPVANGDRTQLLTFRQVTDAEARAIFQPGPEDETNEARGVRVMTGLVAASLCDAQGAPLGTVEEAERLPQKALVALYEAAADVNGIRTKAKAAENEGEQPPKA